jgi:DNA-binding transcriptional ArsR family regulator
MLEDVRMAKAKSNTAVRAPDAERVISDVETLKAISDPLRLRILEAMVTRPLAAWSVKELAVALSVPQTRLYHHVELLVERDLVRAAEQRVVSGIIETRYRLAALSFRLDAGLIGPGGAGEPALREMLETILGETRRDLERVLADPRARDEARGDRPLLSRGVASLTPERAAELRRRLTALLNEYDGPFDDPAAATSTYRMLIAMYADPTSEEASHG